MGKLVLPPVCQLDIHGSQLYFSIIQCVQHFVFISINCVLINNLDRQTDKQTNTRMQENKQRHTDHHVSI